MEDAQTNKILPESNIETATRVLVNGIGVTARLVLHDALAVGLIVNGR